LLNLIEKNPLSKYIQSEEIELTIMWPVIKKIILWVVIGVPALLVGGMLMIYISLPDVVGLTTNNPRTTALMVQRYREAKNSRKDLVIRQQWVSIDEIPNLLKESIRVAEDAAFYQHRGVDFAELKVAFKKNWQKGKYVRGASTITQQLAKNLYLSTDKSVIRKIIFELYLNVIEFGPGIFGVQAAANIFFNKDVNRLNIEETVRLTAVIPKPLKETPIRNSSWINWKAGWILDTLRRYKYINQMEYQVVKERFK
jgi:monofunctional biosynthetic peptidoglycan transglycosylase